VYGYQPGWGLPSAQQQAALADLMAGAPQAGTAPASATSARS
jgi:hypothetical protein